MNSCDHSLPLAHSQSSDGFVRTYGVALSGEQYGPDPRLLIALFALFVLPKSLIPATMGRHITLYSGHYMLWDLAWLMVCCLIVLAARGAGFFRHRPARDTVRWFLIPLLALGLVQVVSIAWSTNSAETLPYAFEQSIHMCAVVSAAVLMFSGLPYQTRSKVAIGTVLILFFVVCVYAGLSFVFPEWRPSYGRYDRFEKTLGFIRVFGPLGQSTTLNFILLPMLGYAAGLIFVPRSTRSFWALICCVLLAAIVGTGSRGAFLCLASFVMFVFISLRIRSLKLLVPAALIGVVAIATLGIPERFLEWRDDARSVSYETAYRAWTDNRRNLLVGTGQGTLSTSLHDITIRAVEQRDRWYRLMVNTEYGWTLASSHSAYLRTLAETGLVGFGLLLIPLAWLCTRLFVHAARDRCRSGLAIHAKVSAAGCAAVLPYMMFESFFINVTWLVFIWSIFVVVAVENIRDTSRKTERHGNPRTAEPLPPGSSTWNGGATGTVRC